MYITSLRKKSTQIKEITKNKKKKEEEKENVCVWANKTKTEEKK